MKVVNYMTSYTMPTFFFHALWYYALVTNRIIKKRTGVSRGCPRLISVLIRPVRSAVGVLLETTYLSQPLRKASTQRLRYSIAFCILTLSVYAVHVIMQCDIMIKTVVCHTTNYNYMQCSITLSCNIPNILRVWYRNVLESVLENLELCWINKCGRAGVRARCVYIFFHLSVGHAGRMRLR